MDIVQAIVTLIVGYWLAGKLRKATRRCLDRFERVDIPLKPLFANIVRYVVLIVTLVAVLAQFGVQTASIIAVLGAASPAIGLALQGTLQNIAAGIMLLLLRPFKVGNFIDAAGKMGTDGLGLFSTEFKNPTVFV
jgi:small conductance mechanosensitive channel